MICNFFIHVPRLVRLPSTNVAMIPHNRQRRSLYWFKWGKPLHRSLPDLQISRKKQVFETFKGSGFRTLVRILTI